MFTSYEVTITMTVVYACMLLVVISVIYAMHNMCREQEAIIELQAERQRLLSEREIAGMVANNIDDLRCLRHELKNQYAYMSILLREQRYGELEEYFSQMAADLPPLLNLANSGKTVIMVSSEMPELLGVCDRIVVMSGGRVAGEVDARNTTQEEIMTLAAKYV